VSRQVWKTRLLIVACTVVVLQALFMTGIAQAVANAAGAGQQHRTCSYAGIAGAWGYTVTGTLLPPTGAVPMAIVGRTVLNADGTATGTQTSSVGGAVSEEATKGAWTVNPDCTGTLTANIYDQSGALVRSPTFNTVYVDNQAEFRAIMKSLVIVKGGTNVNVPAVVTMSGTKLSPSTEDQQ
jgi:hypothetical protein